MEEINWEKIYNFYNTIKSLYAECEETDPELKTNLQPLNEFRAALDHLMRVMAIEKLPAYSERNKAKEAEKLLSHFRRAFFDISDMLAINYRRKIIDLLKVYSTETIDMAIPDYYPKIRPRIEELSQRIKALRVEKGFANRNEEQQVEEYTNIVKELKDFYIVVSGANISLREIRKKSKFKKILLQWVLPILGGIGVIVGIISPIISNIG